MTCLSRVISIQVIQNIYAPHCGFRDIGWVTTQRNLLKVVDQSTVQIYRLAVFIAN